MGTISRTDRPLLPPAAFPPNPADRAPGGWTAGRGGLARRVCAALASVLVVWQKRIRDREALQSMTAAQLADIGITREDALCEAEKPFWHR
ncbi:DUF1127 domain-containing protein [Pelagibius sp. 7325]|uniref:DUF1127 domain-containing protein n=1 Tax=Pelagibius sp. 7325 TaxID=3131994 RepID=UPI0030EC440F